MPMHTGGSLTGESPAAFRSLSTALERLLVSLVQVAINGETTLGSSLSWPQRVLFVVFPDEKSPWSKVDNGDREANEKAVRVLFDCLDRYLLNNAEET